MRRILTHFVACIATLASAPSSTASTSQGTEDALNERPPVTAVARERHWGIDCEALREELLHALADAPSPGERERWDHLLGLCAAIHNTPGTDAASSCPDHTGAREALRRADLESAADRARLRTEMRKHLQCPQ